MAALLRSIDRTAGVILEDGTAIVLAGILATAVLLCAWLQVAALSHRYPLDYGEAPVLDEAMRLAAGENIYRGELASPPFTVSTHPPLYIAVLAPVIKVFGPSFAAGRLISMLSAWGAAATLAVIVQTLVRDRMAAVASGAVFLAIPYVAFCSALARIDLLAVALSLLGLLAVVRWPHTRWGVAAACISLVAAMYTRQSYAVAAPVTATVWMLTQNRRRAIALGAAVVGASLALFVLLDRITDGGFFFNLVSADVGEFRAEVMRWGVARLTASTPILLAVGAASLLLMRRWNPGYAVAAPYGVAAALLALYVAGTTGPDASSFLELSAAMSLAAGLVVAWSRRHCGIHLVRAALLALLALQATWLIQTTYDRYLGELSNRRTVVAELQQLEGMIAAAAAPVLADEYMGIETLQSRPLYLQPFEMTQLARAGMWDQRLLLDGIAQHKFAYILLYGRQRVRQRWTPEMLAAIRANYVYSEVLAENQVYRPPAPTGAVAAAAPPERRLQAGN